jgi:uncharacterized membrane protein SirB2
MYLALKYAHMGLALLTLCGLLLRWGWMLADSPLLQHRLTRILPHVVDTLFLVAGVSLAIMLAQYPFVHAWLTAKVLGLLVYIVLGMYALRLGRNKRTRNVAMALATVVYIYVFSVARSKSALGFLTLFSAQT